MTIESLSSRTSASSLPETQTRISGSVPDGCKTTRPRPAIFSSAAFTAALFERLGYDVTPRCGETRHDIIQAVLLREEKALIAFCQGMQKGAPVDSFVSPEPWDMPGYDSKVIMAAGAFTLGSSIELSADAPLREPFAAWMQGGLNFHSAKMGVLLAAQEMKNRGVI